MTARMCDGHPSAECRSGCVIDCAFNTADIAYTKAAEKHFAPDYGNPGYRHTILDAPGNTMDDFVRWWGNRSMLGQALYVCLAVAACCGVAWVIVGPK